MICIFVKFLHGTMRDSLLALLTTLQTDFRIRICNLIGCTSLNASWYPVNGAMSSVGITGQI